MKKATIIMFFIAVITVVFAEYFALPAVYHFAKPLIMISLIGFYLASMPIPNRSRTVMLAMVFSLAGDVLLMGDGLFIPGLIAFLIAHIFYIMAYKQHVNDDYENALMGIQKIRLAFPIILAGTGLVVILYPVLNELKIPVMVYALVITVMSLQALFRYGRTGGQSFWPVFIGAILFMISDSLIAVNKFLHPFDGAGISIMITYSLAQFLIIAGLIRHE